MANQKGFTLVELLIVVAIIGILSALVIPNLLDAADRARQKATVADMRVWGVALGEFWAQKGVYPPQTLTLIEVRQELVPFAVTTLHLEDHWSHRFIYTSNVVDSYSVRSAGKDGVVGLAATPGSTNYDLDLILNDGVFVNVP